MPRYWFDVLNRKGLRLGEVIVTRRWDAAGPTAAEMAMERAREAWQGQAVGKVALRRLEINGKGDGSTPL